MPHVRSPAFVFLSTLSLRRATRPDRRPCSHCLISIHALLAESDYDSPYTFVALTTFLSTLSLRRATPDPGAELLDHVLFLSTLSLRRATVRLNAKLQHVHISIHALLAESDARYNYPKHD